MNGTRGDYRGRSRRGATTLGVLLAAALSAPPAVAGTQMSRFGPLGLPVRLALRMAAKKLDRPQCQLVYEDFRDPQGKTLRERLTERGESGRDHFLGLIFEDGNGKPACRPERILAYTSPGSGTVQLCTQLFARAALDNVGLAAATAIHEQLHTLGLIENPPTSREITERVLQRCGR